MGDNTKKIEIEAESLSSRGRVSDVSNNIV